MVRSQLICPNMVNNPFVCAFKEAPCPLARVRREQHRWWQSKSFITHKSNVDRASTKQGIKETRTRMVRVELHIKNVRQLMAQPRHEQKPSSNTTNRNSPKHLALATASIAIYL
jgi:hypothetical protein